MEYQFAEQTIDDNFPIVADQQMLDNAHNVNENCTLNRTKTHRSDISYVPLKQ